ncbi:MAG TPA: hypothetical protein VGI45_18955 [Terracidiphilus sp.]|jgi:hypothetical protein
MKLFPARALAVLSIAAILAILPCTAQAPASQPADQQNQPEAAQPSGKVLFHRSLDANGNTVDKTGPAARPAAKTAAVAPVSDADRQAIAVTGLDLDIRLNTGAQQLAARGTVTVRNAGKSPISSIPLQLSSSLNWERIHLDGHDVPLAVATINSDSDHTGQFHEAVVPLAAPLSPGASLQLEVFYSGTIAPTARRLVSVGTPEDSAAHSDWDEISPEFTGLRGFGNVAWYPVASTPVMIGDGARLFDEIGRQKLLTTGTSFRLRLTVEFPHNQPPTVAVVNGHKIPLKVSDPNASDPDVPGIATAETGPTQLGFESPSLFVTTQNAHAGSHMTAYTVTADESAVKSWLAAAANVSPMIERWLGQNPPAQLTILDLPDPEDTPWESGTLLAIPVQDGPPDQIASLLSHSLTHGWMSPAPFWLDEGTANFMGTLWDDHEHHRDQALATLEAGRQALALAEPPSPGEGAGQPLGYATSPVYYRTKAAYILWMLRDVVGDDALGAALRASNAAAANKADPLQAFQTALKTAAPRQNLSWLFADWIDADHGLPDLTIDKTFPNAVQSGNWLVSVTVSNSGYAAAQVPVTVRSATNATTEQVLVPGRGTVTSRLLVQGAPTEVQVNDGTTPETQASVHVMRLDQQPAAQASSVQQQP